MQIRSLKYAAAVLLLAGCASGPKFDVLIRNGTVYDGSGNPPRQVDLGIVGDKITTVKPLRNARANLEVDASGMAVSPGFINMLSWANESLLQDAKSESDIRQGVTLEVMGEGESMGPLSGSMRKEMIESQGDIKFAVTWTNLSGYLEGLERKGISPNVASFVGATTLRVHEIGYADRPPTAEELGRMQQLTREAMEEGALGVASALIYAPGFYAKTDELIALAKIAGEYGGMYISHIRSEGTQLLQAADELIRIAREANVRAEFYHLKAAGRTNWHKLEPLIAKIEDARKAGLPITADMYTYTAGATGLDAAMPPWVQEGGYNAWAQRLKDPAIRRRVEEEMLKPTDQWENFYVAAGSPENILLVGFKNEALKPLTGKTLAQAAAMRGKSAAQTAMDLVIEDGSRVSTVYFLMSEENVRREIALPWVSFDSDAPSLAPEGPFLKSNPHPRAYGNFARLLGKYVREERVISLEEAIRKLTSFPAETLRLTGRGKLEPGFFADVVIFDPQTVADHATYEQPHQFATGIRDVFVNGVPVLKNGAHTGRTPGRFLRGPGYGKTRLAEDASRKKNFLSR